MLPSEARIHACEQRLQLAELEAERRRRALRQSARRAAASPRGMLLGLAIGFGVGRRLRRSGPGLGMRTLNLALPLLRFF